MTFKVQDRGARKVIRSARDLSRGPSIDVGILGDNASEDRGGGVTLAMVALFHEMGLGVPRRSFIRDWAEENEVEITRRLGQANADILMGRKSQEQAYRQFGAWAVGSIQARIRARIPPPLAASTVAAKGSDVPLVDKGQLVSGVASRTNT